MIECKTLTEKKLKNLITELSVLKPIKASVVIKKNKKVYKLEAEGASYDEPSLPEIYLKDIIMSIQTLTKFCTYDLNKKGLKFKYKNDKHSVEKSIELKF
ncbi:MAG: hypothetical protein ACRCX2_15620 [Paraclostridium sp.]